MGQYEYGVSLSKASTPEDMVFVAKAFEAGVTKERQRTLDIVRRGMVVGKDISKIIEDIENGDSNA